MHPIRDDLLFPDTTFGRSQGRTERLVKDVDELLRLTPLRQQCRIFHPRSRFLNRPVVEELLSRALKVGFLDGQEARRICRLAWEVCVWIGGRERLDDLRHLNDLKALTAAHWGNSERLLLQWDDASSRFEAAYRLLEGGSGDLLTEATVYFHHASLLKDLRRLDEALRALEEAGSRYERLGSLHSAGKATLNRAAVLRLKGQPDLAYQEHLRACSLLDEDREPHLVGAAWINLAVFCCYLGRFREAWSVLESCPDLVNLCGKNSTILLNQAWARAKVLQGLQRFPEAESQYEQTRAGFLALEDRYNVGLVELDLALLFAQQGRFDEVQAMARSAFQILSQEPLQDEARAALVLFVEAVRQRQAVETLRSALGGFLKAAHSIP